ncbi:MAG: lipopolysaccharide heptosyltransferase I [Pyrinomonadaceae bacterium]
MKLLIVKLGAIGDIIHTLPALSAIRRAFPAAEIDWVAERRSAEVLREHPILNKLIEVDTRRWRSGTPVATVLAEVGREIVGLRRAEYDIAIDLQGLIKSAAIAKACGAAERWGFSRKDLREPAGRLLLNHAVAMPPQMHVIHKNLTLAQTALDIPVDDRIEFGIATSDADCREAETIVAAIGPKFAILNPAGGWVTKLWHAEKFGMLADRIYAEHGLATVVATGPAETELTERVLAASRLAKIIAVQPSLKGFFELVKLADVYVGGDTGPTHLAIAAGAPVVGIFGPTEWWRNGSLNPFDICVERVDIACRIDCHRRECSNWICMDIDVETMAEAVARRLTSQNAAEPAIVVR